MSRQAKKIDGRANNGGGRAGAGRKATKSALPGGAAFASAVLARLRDHDIPGMGRIKDAEEYALKLLAANDIRVQKETFLALLYWMYGKPVQPVDHNPDNKPVRIGVTIRRIGA